MKRFHVHTHVEDLQASIAFYSKLFGAEPTRIESDYAKWMLEDPRVNFAISTRGSKPGIDHLGFQTDTEEELVELRRAFLVAPVADPDHISADTGNRRDRRVRRDFCRSVDPGVQLRLPLHTSGRASVPRIVLGELCVLGG